MIKKTRVTEPVKQKVMNANQNANKHKDGKTVSDLATKELLKVYGK